MIIEKHFEKKILKDYFFIEGTIEIDDVYFIKQIKKGFKDENNQTHKTNVKSKMTPWKWFVNDSKFIEIIKKFIFYVDQKIQLPPYFLAEAWGMGLKKQEKTLEHTHEPDVWSGAIYLNDHSQTLDFTEINKKIIPSKGKFVLFSSFLKHKADSNLSNDIKWGISFNMASKRYIQYY